MKDIFVAIQNRITNQVPAIRWVDFDLGQLDQAPPPVSWPCALISFQNGTYETISQDANIGLVTIEVVIAFQLRERTHSKANQTYRDEAIGHMDTIEAVRIALSGIDGDTFQALTYAGFANDRRADLRVWRLRFTCEHYPAAPESPFQPLPDGVNVGLCVHPEIQ